MTKNKKNKAIISSNSIISKKFAIILIVILFILSLIATYFLSEKINNAIALKISQYTKTDISFQISYINPLSGSFELTHVVIKDNQNRLIKFNNIYVNLNFISLFFNKLEIEEVSLNTPSTNMNILKMIKNGKSNKGKNNIKTPFSTFNFIKNIFIKKISIKNLSPGKISSKKNTFLSKKINIDIQNFYILKNNNLLLNDIKSMLVPAKSKFLISSNKLNVNNYTLKDLLFSVSIKKDLTLQSNLTIENISNSLENIDIKKITLNMNSLKMNPVNSSSIVNNAKGHIILSKVRSKYIVSKNVNINFFYNNKTLSIDNILIDSPNININSKKADHKKDNHDTFNYSWSFSPIDNIKINNLLILNGRVSTDNLKTGHGLKLSIKNIFLVKDKLILTSSLNKLLLNNHSQGKLKAFNIKFNNRYKAKKIEFDFINNKSNIKLKNLNLKSPIVNINVLKTNNKRKENLNQKSVTNLIKNLSVVNTAISNGNFKLNSKSTKFHAHSFNTKFKGQFYIYKDYMLFNSFSKENLKNMTSKASFNAKKVISDKMIINNLKFTSNISNKNLNIDIIKMNNILVDIKLKDSSKNKNKNKHKLSKDNLFRNIKFSKINIKNLSSSQNSDIQINNLDIIAENVYLYDLLNQNNRQVSFKKIPFEKVDIKLNSLKIKNNLITNLSIIEESDLKNIDKNSRKFLTKLYLNNSLVKTNYLIKLKDKKLVSSSNININELDIKDFCNIKDKNDIYMNGNISLHATIHHSGYIFSPDINTINSHIIISGKNMDLHNIDLDQAINQFKESQEIGILKVSSFFLAGPLGLILFQGSNLTRSINAFLKIGHTTNINELHTELIIKNGIVKTQDVAFSTQKNRISIKGKVNLIKKEFDNLKIYILDDKGCSEISETIEGNFNNPKIKKSKLAIQSIAGPLLGVLKKSERILRLGNCKKIYNGVIKHPKGSITDILLNPLKIIDKI